MMAMMSNGHPLTDMPARRAREQLDLAVVELAGAEPGGCAEVLDSVAYDIGRLVGHGFLDRAVAADALTHACTASGLAAEAGPDLVQETIAAGFQAGDRAASAERASARIEGAPTFVARCLADIDAAPIKWLWPKRFALGKLSLIAGQPGLGKSQTTLAMVAAVTTAGRWPDGESAPLGSAVLVSCEDDAGDTIRPRLEAAGADLARVTLFDWALSNDGKERRHFDVAEHMPALSDLVTRLGDVRLIVIDPITAYMGRADSHKTADVRTALVPLQALAAEAGVAIILVSHLNKNGADRAAMNRVVGSGAFVAVCRSAWLIAPDSQDADKRRRILTPLKNNIGDDRTGFAFTVEPESLPNGIATSRIEFDPTPVYVAADELLSDQSAEMDGDSGALEHAQEFIRAELAKGPKPVKLVNAEAKALGIKERTLSRARSREGIVSRKDGPSGAWRLHLCDQG